FGHFKSPLGRRFDLIIRARRLECGVYDALTKEKGKIVSVHQSRLQTENGTTQCFGQFQTESGQYKDWSGSIIELTNKEVVGWARVSK
ncbi:hypothetical protein ACSTE1_20820, partial [Vibrio vulnificus]